MNNSAILVIAVRIRPYIVTLQGQDRCSSNHNDLSLWVYGLCTSCEPLYVV